MAPGEPDAGGVPASADPEEALDRLLRDLRSRRTGVTGREAARRLVSAGPNELVRGPREGWVRQLGRQLLHPLALLLWMAAALAAVAGTTALAAAIVAVVWINAAFAFVQERHAERAVEAFRRTCRSGLTCCGTPPVERSTPETWCLAT